MIELAAHRHMAQSCFNSASAKWLNRPENQAPATRRGLQANRRMKNSPSVVRNELEKLLTSVPQGRAWELRNDNRQCRLKLKLIGKSPSVNNMTGNRLVYWISFHPSRIVFETPQVPEKAKISRTKEEMAWLMAKDFG